MTEEEKDFYRVARERLAAALEHAYGKPARTPAAQGEATEMAKERRARTDEAAETREEERRRKNREYGLRWRERNRERLREKALLWYREHRGRAIESSRRWRKNNREAYNAYQREYRRKKYARKREAAGKTYKPREKTP